MTWGGLGAVAHGVAEPGAGLPTDRRRISSRFGPRVHPVTGELGKMHGGLDLRLSQGTPIVPLTAGRVIRVTFDHPIGGTSVKVDHGNGWRSSYSHLSAAYVNVDEVVSRATLLGLSGGSLGTRGAGRSTGPHLHLVVWKQNPTEPERWQRVDPEPLLWWA